MMLDRGKVLVWEWQDEGSLWKPYSPQLAHYIEQVLRENPRASSVSLGEADTSLTPYILDLISMNQFRLDTGTLYPVRRVSFPLSTAPGQCIAWEWEELPGHWVPFETRLSVLIQEALERQQLGVRLGESCSGSHVCFQTMTQILFPSQKRIRIRARAQKPYPTVGIKRPPTEFQTALAQHLSGNINSRHGSLNAYGSPVTFSQGLADYNQGLVNANHGLVRSDRGVPNYNQEFVNFNRGLVNINQGLVNPNQGIINSSHLLVNSNPLTRNSQQRTMNARLDPMNSNYGLADASPTLGNSNNEIMNSNQILMNFNSGVVNFSTEPLHSNDGLVDSNDLLVNYNQDVDNTSNELINFDANVISPSYTPSYGKTTALNYSPEPGNPNPMIFDSNIGLPSTSPQWAHMDSDCRLDNASPTFVRSISRQADSRTGLVRSDSNYKAFRPDVVRSESRTAGCTTVFKRSNSRCEECRSEIYMSDARSPEIRPEMLRSDSRPIEYKPEFVRSNSRPADFQPGLVRTNSKLGFARSDSRSAEFRPALLRSASRHDEIQSVVMRSDCRNVISRPGFVRSYSRPADPKPELVRSPSRSTDSHNHFRAGIAGRSLSRSASLRGSRSPPPCTCPQCLLVQSVKSASWPGRPSLKTPVKGQWHDSHRRERGRSITRVPPVPLSNIEGSGMISPALAGISGLLMSAAGLPVCLSISTSPVFCPPPVKKKDLRPVPGVQGSSRKIGNQKGKKPAEMIKQFLQRVKTLPSEDCTLCKRTLAEGEIGRLYRCSHTYHVRCLAPLYKDGTLRCPTCQTLFGAKIGSQPPGKMSFHIIPHSLPGYPDCETIRIIYHISPGVQGPGQPHPGMKYTAPDFPLHCYLPNTKKGREALLLLIKAWERRLLFPVHPSRAPGVPDSVSISRIPHKTEFGSNVTGKGFPDSRYLDSVLRQLRDWGLTGD
ncbi:E3 ubiquitin-protein ligase DTX1-like [Pseudophryne corroboree]|uniref:E3 ubiquitin-protein ligase DTX1-like n=1 Tax=Pseudophryne corroboree TaxID=495146 RepID=UPI00308138D4